MNFEFTPYGKTPRLRRDAVVTEKLDGTNAGVLVLKLQDGQACPANALAEVPVSTAAGESRYAVAAQSRKRLITPGKTTDNYGFAAYVQENAEGLVRSLGEGLHFGEWWGHDIGRGYGLEPGDRRFWLFNAHRYSKALPSHPEDPRPRVPGLGVVPVLAARTFSTEVVDEALAALAHGGSLAAPGYMRPEGVIVFHSQSGQVFKALLENDDISKTEAGAA